MNRLGKWYAVMCMVMLVYLGLQWGQHNPIQTQLTALLPQETATNPIFQAADQALEHELNQSIIILVGAQESEHAFQAAQQVAQTWQQSGLFQRLDSTIQPDLNELRQSIQQLGIATLPETQIRQLYEQPQRYFAERAEAILNPFSASLLPLESDWLGVSRFAIRSDEGFHWHSEQAMLYTEYDGKTWVLLRAQLPNTSPNPALLTLWHNSKITAQKQHYQLLATGGALFAADAKQSAESESTWMSLVGISLTFALLFMVFRSWRIGALIVPLSLGMLWGVAITLLIFGEIHVLTLVVGTSLVGVLVDFPLHWLAPSLFLSDTSSHHQSTWHATNSMKRILPAFLVSLSITALGYILLWFTPLPILRQTAIFSVAALLGSLMATVCFLPVWFRAYRPKETPFARLMWWTHRFCLKIKGRYVVAMVILLAISGIWQVQWHDDIRNWMVLRPDLLSDAQQVAQISGRTSSQTVVLSAPTQDELLKKNQALERALSPIVKVQSLNQWILPTDEQIKLKQQLHHIAQHREWYEPLLTIGLPEDAVQTALETVAQTQPVSLADSLNAPQAAPFRTLYLGKINGQYVSLARIYGQSIQTNALPYGQLLDKRVHLNQQFSQTRNLAAYLKIISFVLAWGALWYGFGWRRGSVMLAVPALAVLATLGLLGWLHLPLSLFALFGLLLAAAIGVDYAVYAVTAPEIAPVRMAGITLAALTTGISFALLAGSATPAVAAFGLSVSFGVIFNWLLAMMLVQSSHFQAA